MEPKIKIRLSWVKLYQESGNAGKVCSHYGISRFTLRKWYKRYELLGVEGLHSLSRELHTSPYQKLNYISEQQILVL